MVEVSDMTPPREFVSGMDKIDGLRAAAARIAEGDSPPRMAAAIELLLEGLHLSNKLNKTLREDGAVYGRRA
jgi:magnesium chelatase subunit I